MTPGNLMGHADTTMIARVSRHLSQDSEHLIKALGKANGQAADQKQRLGGRILRPLPLPATGGYRFRNTNRDPDVLVDAAGAWERLDALLRPRSPRVGFRCSTCRYRLRTSRVRFSTDIRINPSTSDRTVSPLTGSAACSRIRVH